MMGLMNNALRIELEDDPLGYIFQSVWDRFLKVRVFSHVNNHGHC